MFNTTATTTVLTDAEIDAIVCAEITQTSYIEEELRTFIGRFDTLADALYQEEAELLV